MSCWKKFSFLFMNLCLRLKSLSLYSLVSVVVFFDLLSLVVYFLPRKMATLDYDVIDSAVRNEEYKKSTWFNEPHNSARSERRCLRVIQRDCDQTLGQTLHALENVIAFIVGEDFRSNFGFYSGKQTFFDICLDTQQEMKKGNSMKLPKKILICVRSLILCKSRWARNSQPCCATAQC